ncbi:MAG TPA: PKD domain-containing protein [Bacteroidales bacterium]
MKKKKENINLRELFSRKLRKTEVLPDASVRSKLMRRVARKEFVRFNASRLNIYYLGGILISGIATGLLIFSSSEKSDQLNKSVTTENVINTDTVYSIEVPAEKPQRKDPDRSKTITGETKSKLAILNLADKERTNSIRTVDSNKDRATQPTSINSSLSKRGLFSEAANNQKLQNGYKPDALLIDPCASVGCAPMKVRFYNKSTSYDSCRWTFGEGGYSNKKDPEWIFDVAGEYKVVLNVYSDGGKVSSSVATVTVHPRPQAHFEISPAKVVLPNDEIRFMNFSTNAVQFRWKFGDGTTSESFEPVHSYTKYASYNVSLVVFSDWGCSDSLTVLNAFSGSQYFIVFPNAFIPNPQGPSGGYYSSKSDESAQVFHPSFSGVSDYQLKIFSKLGIMIFESSDINLGWDGYNKGQLCDPGVYIWKVRGKFRNGEPFIKMGDVTLLKN